MSPIPSLLLSLPILLILLPHPSAAPTTRPAPGESEPTPAPWPLQFHSILLMSYSGNLSLIDLWYDWPNGRNFNIIRDQLGGPPLYDLEWNNGTSFFYTLAPPLSCRSAHLPVGILRPDWLDGAAYLGRRTVDGFLCDVWTKADFITYYEDVATNRPVQWVFYTVGLYRSRSDHSRRLPRGTAVCTRTDGRDDAASDDYGRAVHVMTFEVGAVLEDAKWQAPVYCFTKEEESPQETQSLTTDFFYLNQIEKSSLRGLSGF